MPPKVPCRITETVMKLIATTCWYTCQWWVLKTVKCDFNRGFLLWLGCIECQKHLATCRGYPHLFWEPTNVDGNLNHWETVVWVRACIVVVSSANRALCSSYMLCSAISEYVREFVCLLFVCLFNPLQYQMYCKVPFSNCMLWTDILSLYSK